MNPTKPAAWRSFCPQFNRGLTFQLVLNLGKGHSHLVSDLGAARAWPVNSALGGMGVVSEALVRKLRSRNGLQW